MQFICQRRLTANYKRIVGDDARERGYTARITRECAATSCPFKLPTNTTDITMPAVSTLIFRGRFTPLLMDAHVEKIRRDLDMQIGLTCFMLRK